MPLLDQRAGEAMRRLTVTRGPHGWHLTEEQDAHIVRDVTYTDWHRVERAVKVFERAADPATIDA